MAMITHAAFFVLVGIMLLVNPSQGFQFRYRRFPPHRFRSSTSDDFDPKDFIKVLKAGSSSFTPPPTNYNEGAEFVDELKEQIFRKYPYADIELPVLPDCDNYFSGKSGDFFWHQNSDQVFVFFPLKNDIDKRDISVKFQALKVEVNIGDSDPISFNCMERIIPGFIL